MGADMLVACFYEPIDPDFKPNWEGASKYLEEQITLWIKKNKIPSCLDYLDNPEQAGETLRSNFEEVKNAYKNGDRELVSLEFTPYRVYLTGGKSWGDSPSEIFNSINNLNELNLLDQAGFNQIPDYKKMVDKMLGVKDMLPLFIGLNTDLDALISKRLSKKPKTRRKSHG